MSLDEFAKVRQGGDGLSLEQYAESLTAFTATEVLKKFSRLSDGQKQAVLLGQAGHRIVFYDIEATHLKPNVGRILCCSFKPLGEEPYTFSALERRFKKKDVYDDSRLAEAIRDELEGYDLVVGHNSKLFDTKFINARNLRAGQRTKKAQYQVDTMWVWRSKANAWSGLDAVQKFIDPEGTSKTVIDWRQWMRALGWDPELRRQAVAEIVDHCEKDVQVLERVYVHMVKAGAVRSVRRDGGVL